MTPALGLTVYHPDKADHGYTLFAHMTGTSAYLIHHCLELRNQTRMEVF